MLKWPLKLSHFRESIWPLVIVLLIWGFITKKSSKKCRVFIRPLFISNSLNQEI